MGDIQALSITAYVCVCLLFCLTLAALVLSCMRKQELSYILLMVCSLLSLLVVVFTGASALRFSGGFVADIYCKNLLSRASPDTRICNVNEGAFYGNDSSLTWGPSHGWNGMIASFVWSFIQMFVSLMTCFKERHKVAVSRFDVQY
jgi:ABC-type transport system involved in multi-copper enzyme maturation permease subunit